jgi:hypothetical protein
MSAAICSGKTARPTSGTNAIRPTPDQADHHPEDHEKHAAQFEELGPDESRDRASGLAERQIIARRDNLQQQVQQVDRGDPQNQRHGRQRRNQRPFDDEAALAGGSISVNHEGEIRGARDRVGHHQCDAEHQIAAEQPAARRDESIDVEARSLSEIAERERFPFDVSGLLVRGEHHVHDPALDEKHQDRATDQDDAEGRDECDQGDRLRHQGVRDRGEDLAHAALQQVAQVAAQEHRNQDGGADDRHGEERLKGRLRDELNGDDGPVRGGQQPAAFEQQLQLQIDFTIAPVYPVIIAPS